MHCDFCTYPAVTPRNEVSPTANHASTRQRYIICSTTFIFLLLTISRTRPYYERLKSSLFPKIHSKFLRNTGSSGGRHDVMAKDVDIYEDMSGIPTDLSNSNIKVKETIVYDGWPAFDEAEFERRLQAISDTDVDDERVLQSILKKSTCSVYPAPSPLKSKKGFAATMRKPGESGSYAENIPRAKAMSVGWNYSWNPARVSQQPRQIEFIPMVWGGLNGNKDFKSSLQTHIVPNIKAKLVSRVLGFNEPDNAEQSNMSVNTALARWSVLETLNVPLASPSAAHPNRNWFPEFMTKAKDLCLRVDYIGVHRYQGPNFEEFQKFLTNIHDTYQKPLLITEFAVADWNAKTIGENRYSQSEVLNFMKQALPWLETTSWIAGYAWFNFPQTSAVGTSSALFDVQGELTTLGRYYQSVRNDRRKGDQSITIFDF